MPERLRLTLAVIIIAPACFVAGCARASNLLNNPGFELGAAQAIDGWRFDAWRNSPALCQFSRDEVKRSGKFAAKIQNIADNYSLLIQEVPTTPGTIYRVSGWLRTEDVKLSSSQIGAHLSISTKDLQTAIRSASLKGTHDWTQVEFYFKAGPNRTSVPISCGLGYHGSVGTGTAWFDDIEVAKVLHPAPQDVAAY